MLYTDAILTMGEGTAADAVVRRAARSGKPIFEARMKPRGRKAFAGRKLLAFAGIGHPEKFFASVEEAGGIVALKRPFPDHHFYAEDELADLAHEADKAGLGLVTTAKDAVRLQRTRFRPASSKRSACLKSKPCSNPPPCRKGSSARRWKPGIGAGYGADLSGGCASRDARRVRA